ncbi:MAG: transposase [Chlamydiota bacterium]
MGNKNLAKPCIKAVKSLKRHWEGLTTFVKHPHVPMDNNSAERELRKGVIGRKNYYGSGSKKSAEFKAIAFSIIQTLLIWEVNPQSWFEKFFNFMGEAWNKPLGSWLPWNMTPSRLKELSLKNYHDPPS